MANYALCKSSCTKEGLLSTFVHEALNNRLFRRTRARRSLTLPSELLRQWSQLTRDCLPSPSHICPSKPVDEGHAFRAPGFLLALLARGQYLGARIASPLLSSNQPGKSCHARMSQSASRLERSA